MPHPSQLTYVNNDKFNNMTLTPGPAPSDACKRNQARAQVQVTLPDGTKQEFHTNCMPTFVSKYYK